MIHRLGRPARLVSIGLDHVRFALGSAYHSPVFYRQAAQVAIWKTFDATREKGHANQNGNMAELVDARDLKFRSQGSLALIGGKALRLNSYSLEAPRGPESRWRFEPGRSIMNSPNHSSAAIREAWEKIGKQRWDGRTHGRGLGLLIVDALTANGTLTISRLKSPGWAFEFWRDQNKIRGRFIGVGNSVVVAKLNGDGLPE